MLAAANSAGVDSEPASASASSADDVVMYAFNDDGSATVSAIAFDVAAADSDVAELEASVARHPAATPGASSSISAAARAPAPAAPDAPAAPGRVAAEGQHEDSAMAAFTSDDMLCMLYGVDQDKEDAKHKVAFFDVDAVVDPEALRRVLAAAAAESADPTRSRLRRRPRRTTSSRVSRRRVRDAPRGRASRSRPRSRSSPFSSAPSASSRLPRLRLYPPPSETRPSRRSAARRARRRTRPASRRRFTTRTSPRGVPEAERYAKQLRYDGYKIVLRDFRAGVSRRAARALGASRVIGAALEKTVEGTFTGAFAATPDAGCDDGEAKRNRVESFAREAGVSLKNSIAYARAGTDAALMRRVGKAYAVSPDARLASRAEAEGWRTLRWAEDAAMAREREAAAEAARVAAAARSVAPKKRGVEGVDHRRPGSVRPGKRREVEVSAGARATNRFRRVRRFGSGARSFPRGMRIGTGRFLPSVSCA